MPAPLTFEREIETRVPSAIAARVTSTISPNAAADVAIGAPAPLVRSHMRGGADEVVVEIGDAHAAVEPWCSRGQCVLPARLADPSVPGGVDGRRVDAVRDGRPRRAVEHVVGELVVASHL